MNNNFFTWDKDFVTGIDIIDEQHHKLVETINYSIQLSIGNEKTDNKKIYELRDHLENYVVEHFETEEKLMEDYLVDKRYFDIHKKTHNEFIEKVKKCFIEIGEDFEPSKLGDINEFLIRWLAYHILNMDKSLIRQINYIKEDKMSPLESYEKEKELAETATEPLLKALKALFYVVSEKNKELEQKNQDLERKVKERTNELEEANEKLEKISIVDELTGLPNRRFVMMQIDQLISYWERYGTKFSLLFIDLDRFKPVNDNYGHEYGDRVLVWIGNFLKKNSRKSDIPCRLGGDEFVIICPNLSGREALEFGKIINEKAMSRENNENLDYWEPSFSIGVTEMEKEIKTASDILNVADTAMYKAKKKGGGQVAFINNNE